MDKSRVCPESLGLLKTYILLLGLLIAAFFNLKAQSYEVPIAVHILRNNEGNIPRASSANIDNEIANLNDAYDHLGINFIKCSEGFVDSTEIWFQFDVEDNLLAPYLATNVVNVFITDLEGSLNGKAVFPYKQTDWILLDYGNMGTSTLIHEFGHYFGLRHTYQGVDEDDPTSPSSLTISVAEGPLGWKYGDYLIDTPLDPENRSDFNTSCNYIGDQTDANGDLFTPEGKNYMGKGHSYCRSEFSPGQEARILEYLKRDRYFLDCGSSSNTNLTCANSPSVFTFPHHDDFDRSDTNAYPYWVQARHGDDLNWRNSPSTPSSSTGPDAAQSGQTVMFFEASVKYTTDDETILLSPCYDFNDVENPAIEFYYHMYGAETGTLQLEISTDAGTNWNSLFVQSGQQHSDETSPWTHQEVDLSAYEGNRVQLRFRAIGSGSSKSDISIDNVTVSATSLSIDKKDKHQRLSIHPNPANHKITIQAYDFSVKETIMYNLLGQQLSVHNYIDDGSTEVVIDVTNLINGVYIVRVKSTQNQYLHKKIRIQQQ